MPNLNQQAMRTQKILVSLSLLLLSSASIAQPSQRISGASLETQIEALVAAQLEAEALSGVLVIAQEGELVFQKAYGYADWEHRTPNSLRTRFGIASITKPMTEIVVNLMIEDGLLDLDSPVEKYLNGFPKGPNGGVATLRHLLTHRSGVPHRVTKALDETQPIFPAEIVSRVLQKGLLFEPGSQRLYSSAGFTCLARVIEIIEGKPFETVLGERVFQPAKMATALSETGRRLMPFRAFPYGLGSADGKLAVKKAPYKDLRFLTGAGSVYASVEDLLQLIESIRAGVFGEESKEELFSGNPSDWTSWTGRTNGYEASVDLLPSENLVFIFLSNLQSAANWQVRGQVKNLLMGEDIVSIPSPPQVAESFEDPSSLEGLFGGRAEIRFDGGALFRGDNEFYPVDGERYYTPASGSYLRFRRDSNGAVDALVSIRPNGEESVLLKSIDH